GFQDVLVQSDSRAAISLILEDGVATHQHAGKVRVIKELLRRNWRVSFSYIYREANKSADFLAILGHDQELGLHSIDISDCNLGYFLRLDCMGIFKPITILIN
ncbi:Putative ribonuclease H protein At1g65750, partial [Linum perenne]